MTDERRPGAGATTTDQGSGTLSSNRRGAGSGGPGFVGGDGLGRRSKADAKRAKGDRLGERHGCESGAHAGVPEAARGKIVMRLGRVVGG
jgi:hypothetical protein